MTVAPAGRRDLDAWVRAARPARRETLDPRRPAGVLREVETAAPHRPVEAACVFLTNRECPWACVMCDLWKHTLVRSGPAGAVAEQVAAALPQVGSARWIKLYNAGSLFDERAVPAAERAAVARLVAGFERVIVESHPALVGPRVVDFARALRGRLEVAMGLEVASERVLQRLNKHVTLEGFAAAAEFLRGNGVDLRAFVLVPAPYLTREEGVREAVRSVAFAGAVGARVAALIPTRLGNGAMEMLHAAGDFVPPRLGDLEAALDGSLAMRGGTLVVADLWDVEQLSDCAACLAPRKQRLQTMNLAQGILEPVVCGTCGAGGSGIG